MSEPHEKQEEAGKEHFHERLERMEKHLGLPKYDHEESKKSPAQKKEDAMRKRHRR